MNLSFQDPFYTLCLPYHVASTGQADPSKGRPSSMPPSRRRWP
jgi:hypothetical protein